MIQFANTVEEERWAGLSADDRKKYIGMAEYLREQYDVDSVSLADIDTALAVGA